MVLKGKTTIQLFDSKTGELLDTVEKSNIVTNAVNNVLNGALQALAYTSNNGKGRKSELYKLFDFPNGYDLAKSLFGGVLVFSKSIEENVDHVIPSIDEIKSFIGCANQSKGIEDNTFKGSINESLSEVGDDYIKFVWDFSPDQCNGDIACVCLTSDCGGSTGYGFDSIASASSSHLISKLDDNMWDSSASLEFNPSYIHNPMFATSFSSLNEHDMYINENYLYYVYRDTAYKYDVSRLYDSSKIGVELFSKFDYGNTSDYDEAINLSTFEYHIFNCADDDCVYEIDTNQTDSEYLTLIKVSGDAVTEIIQIPTTNILTSLYEYHNDTSRLYQYIKKFNESGIISNNKIYFLTGSVDPNLTSDSNKLRMYVLSFDGSFKYKDIDCTPTVIGMLFDKSVGGHVDSNMGVRFVKIFNKLFLQSNSEDKVFKYFIVDDDGNISGYPIFATNRALSLYGSSLNTSNPWVRAPWVTFKFAGNNFIEAIHLIQGYLATINNLDVVLTKTSNKTMRITYRLTQL